MVARFTAAGLGLLAFTITVGAGLIVQNPVEVTLSRSIFALILFSLLGLVLGSAAQRVVFEREKEHASKIRDRYREDPEASVEEDSHADEAAPVSADVG